MRSSAHDGGIPRCGVPRHSREGGNHLQIAATEALDVEEINDLIFRALCDIMGIIPLLPKLPVRAYANPKRAMPGLHQVA